MSDEKWLVWVKQLQAIAQIGLTYTEDAYDRERYEQIQVLAAEIAAEYTGVAQGNIEKLFQHERGYATPKVDVRGAVFNDAGQVLLVKEARSGEWTLPGGWADVWDTPAQGVEREIREESGYDATATKLVACYDRTNQGYRSSEFSIYKLFFLCTLQGGSAQTSHETTEVSFFAADALPPLDEGRTLKKHLLRCFAHYQDSSLPTEFD